MTTTHDICDACECVRHCSQHGCIPLTVEAKKPTKEIIMSNDSSSSSSSSGIGVLGLLGVVFVVLKLMGFLGWSWWLVTLPFYGAFVLVLGFALAALLGTLLFLWLDDRKEEKARKARLAETKENA
jgi:hypothetical protein